MDKTAKYARMSDYPLIQDRWEPRVGDWTDRGIVIEVSPSGLVTVWEKADRIGAGRTTNPKKHYRWRPRQDQLWDMSPDKDVDLIKWADTRFRDGKYLCVLYADIDTGMKEEHFPGDTPEQALIQGVMHNHNKKWDEWKGWITV